MYIINSIADVLEIILDESNSFSHFRGHSDKEYLLKPSIGRNSKNFGDWLFEIDNKTEISEEQKISVGLQQYEWWALSEFKARKMPFHNDNLNYFDLMILAQHHGLRTRLLDVTTNPLVAIYFACENTKMETLLLLIKNGKL